MTNLSPRSRGLLALTALVASAGCAAPRLTMADVAPLQVVLDTLPRGAQVELGQAVLGFTPLVHPLGAGAPVQTLVFTQAGYRPLAMRLDDPGSLAGRRLLVVLSPEGLEPAGEVIAADDAGRVAQAGAVLANAERCEEALQYFEHAAEVDPRLPLAQKGLGRCYARLKRNQEALKAYKQFLLIAPQSPDAARIKEIVSKAEGDIDPPERKVGR